MIHSALSAQRGSMAPRRHRIPRPRVILRALLAPPARRTVPAAHQFSRPVTFARRGSSTSARVTAPPYASHARPASMGTKRGRHMNPRRANPAAQGSITPQRVLDHQHSARLARWAGTEPAQRRLRQTIAPRVQQARPTRRAVRLQSTSVSPARRDGIRGTRAKRHALRVSPASTGSRQTRSPREAGARIAGKARSVQRSGRPTWPCAMLVRQGSTAISSPKQRGPPAYPVGPAPSRLNRVEVSSVRHVKMERHRSRASLCARPACRARSSWTAIVGIVARGGIRGSRQRHARDVRKVGFKMRQAKRRVRRVSPGSTTTSISRQRTRPVNHAGKASSVQRSGRRPWGCAMLVRQGSTATSSPKQLGPPANPVGPAPSRLNRVEVSSVRHVKMERHRSRVSPCAQHACLAKSSWAAIVGSVSRGGIRGSRQRHARDVRKVGFKMRQAKRRVRPVSLGSTGYRQTRSPREAVQETGARIVARENTMRLRVLARQHSARNVPSADTAPTQLRKMSACVICAQQARPTRKTARL